MHDRSVPLIVFAPGLATHKKSKRTSMDNVAPTIAKLLGVPKPAHANGQSLY